MKHLLRLFFLSGFTCFVTGCYPVYQNSGAPEIPGDFWQAFHGDDERILLFPVLKSEISEYSTLGAPRVIRSFTAPAEYDLRWRIDSPFGVIAGEKYAVEELCFVSQKGKVLSLRRKVSSGSPNAIWREKFTGSIIEAGRLHLLELLRNRKAEFSPPREVLSACSLDHRRAKGRWSAFEREIAIDFLSALTPNQR